MDGTRSGHLVDGFRTKSGASMVFERMEGVFISAIKKFNVSRLHRFQQDLDY